MTIGEGIATFVLIVIFMVAIGAMFDRLGWSKNIGPDSALPLMLVITVCIIAGLIVKNWDVVLWILLIGAAAVGVVYLLRSGLIGHPFDRVGRTIRLERQQERRIRKLLYGRTEDELEEWEANVLAKIRAHYAERIGRMFE